MTPARAGHGHGRRPHTTGSDRAPSANSAPAGRRSAGLRTAAAVVIANEMRGAERPVPQNALTTADCGSREEPTPRGSPAIRWWAATAAPARSKMTSAPKHRRAVVTLLWGSAIRSTVLTGRDAVSRAGRSESGEASTHRKHGAGHTSSADALPVRPAAVTGPHAQLGRSLTVLSRGPATGAQPRTPPAQQRVRQCASGTDRIVTDAFDGEHRELCGDDCCQLLRFLSIL